MSSKALSTPAQKPASASATIGFQPIDGGRPLRQWWDFIRAAQSVVDAPPRPPATESAGYSD